MTVFIYQDYVHNNGVLFRALCDYFGANQVRYCDAADILGGCLEDAQLFVMPGGADLYYCEKLNGEGNKSIRSFVENGGSYLGICAGAYYGCAALEWAKDEAEPICGSRELAFYDGTAIGPVYEFIEDGDIGKSWDAAAAITMDDETATVFYSGGPIFTETGNAEILARYSTLPGNPPAIIACTAGKGRVILSSPHLEYRSTDVLKSGYDHGNSSPERKIEIANLLRDSDDTAQKIWTILLRHAVKDPHVKEIDQKQKAQG